MAASPRNRKNAPAAAGSSDSGGAAVSPAFSLETVIAATKAGSFTYTPVAFHNPLIESGDVEINPEMVDENGMIATRATAKHTESKEMTDTAQTAQPAAAVKPKFEIEANVPIPERTRNATGLRAGRTPVYPFDALEIGQSFFVPNGADEKGVEKPAAKAMASTVAGANARYVEVIEGQTRTNRKGSVVPATKQLRKFKIFDTERDVTDAAGVVTKQKGARIFRVALTEEKLDA